MSTDEIVDRLLERLDEQPAHIPSLDKKCAAVLEVLWPSTPTNGATIANSIKAGGRMHLGPGSLRPVMITLQLDGRIQDLGHDEWVITQAGLEWLGQYQQSV